MGCLNSEGQFTHWFGNIHLSGPCNRSCYFCIGQHMMALDQLNTLDTWPLPGLEDFIQKCKLKGVQEINLTGSNTDPLLFKHHDELCMRLRYEFPNGRLGIRTNGVTALAHPEIMEWYDKASLSVTSLDPDIYRKTMGQGIPPDVAAIIKRYPAIRFKANVVLCPETVESGDIYRTLNKLDDMGIRTVNLREPYGQPHLGSPLRTQTGTRLGMPRYVWGNMDVTYWDVHYVEVESVNLYANGIVSETYPVTKGHAPTGIVRGQENFATSGRHTPQWIR